MPIAVLHESPPAYQAAAGRRYHFTAHTGPAIARARWERVPQEQRSAIGRSMRAHPRQPPPSPHADLHELVCQCSPTAIETRAMLNALVAAFGMPRASDLLAVHMSHIPKILSGGTPSRPLRKHVWLVWALLLAPEGVQGGFGLLTCNRWTLHSGPQHVGLPRPATIEPLKGQRRGRKPAARPGATSD